MARANTPTAARMFRVPPDARVQLVGADLKVFGPSRAHVFLNAGGQVQMILDQLKEWISPATVFETAIARLGPEGGVTVTVVLNGCRSAGVLEEAVFERQTCLARIRVTPGSGLSQGPLDRQPEYPLVFAAATSLAPRDGGWQIASPYAAGQAWVSGDVLAGQLAQVPGGWTPCGETQKHIAIVLADAGLLVSAQADRPQAMLADHELRLHVLSRQGSAATAVGATGHDPSGAPAALEDRKQGDVAIALPIPTEALDMGLGQVFASRSSARDGTGRQALTPKDLSDLLWVAARNLGKPVQDEAGFERLARPYPGAGGCHELDIFVAQTQPTEPLPGFARYDACHHALIPISASPDRLLRDAASAMGQPNGPPALLVLGARFGRISWKYGDASYALMLKDSGVLLQTLHLTCVALGLGSCILGGGNSRHFASASGLDPGVQGPVGEIALFGRKRSY